MISTDIRSTIVPTVEPARVRATTLRTCPMPPAVEGTRVSSAAGLKGLVSSGAFGPYVVGSPAWSPPV